MAIIGYARVSSIGQKLDVQLEKLTSQGCEKVYQEKESASSTKRPQLVACLDYVREGDILVITKLDRLARSTLDLCNIAKLLEDKGVALKVIDQNIDTSSSTGRLLFNVLGSIAQFETEIRAERQMDGIKKAKENGVAFGRVKTLTSEQVTELKSKRQSGTLIKELMSDYKLSKKSIYNYLELSKQNCTMTT
jgi:DNA invertase Pin-like site-specific DNA recombinase